jgi:uncharacterized protein
LILYLHGFRSTPQSTKASLIRSALDAGGWTQDYVCPQLPVSPRAAAKLVLATAQMEAPEQLAVIGSSLGGYYATWVAEQLGCRAVLLNPAIKPYEDLRPYVGEQTVHGTDEVIDFKPQYLEELQAIDTPRITRPERYFLIAATGDELIDYRTMVAKYTGARQTVIRGSDHQLSDFPKYLNDVLAFCGIPLNPES